MKTILISGLFLIENNYQKKTDDALTTNNKSIVDSINEVNTQCKDIINSKADKNDLQVQKSRIDNSSLGDKGNTKEWLKWKQLLPRLPSF